MVIVGGGRGGARAAVAFRENGYEGPVTLITDEELAPYDRPPLSKSNITEEAEPAPTLLLDEGMIASLKVNFIKNRAQAIDAHARSVTLASGARLGFDKLLLSPGASARALTLPGCERALTLRDFGHALLIREAFKQKKSVAIIGGGFIGLELASSAATLGCETTVIEALPRVLMRGVPEAIAQRVSEKHKSGGVKLVTSAAIDKVDETSVMLMDGTRIAADILIAGIGASPRTELARGAGLTIENGVFCDGHLQTSHPDIYAIGDCCSFPHSVFDGLRMRLESWRAAADQAAVAVVNMLGSDKAYESVPWFWSDQFDLNLQIAGMPHQGVSQVERPVKDGAVIICHLDQAGRLVGASGIGTGNSIARDVRLLELLIGKRASPSAEQLADPGFALRTLLKAA
jgi:3-phenylpropionate/trans-cinnamate dioxygenase ferredoxin reductase component